MSFTNNAINDRIVAPRAKSAESAGSLEENSAANEAIRRLKGRHKQSHKRLTWGAEEAKDSFPAILYSSSFVCAQDWGMRGGGI